MTKYQYHAHFSTIPPPTLSCDILTIAKFPLQNVKIVKYKETDFAKLDCSKIIGALEKKCHSKICLYKVLTFIGHALWSQVPKICCEIGG